MDDIATPRAGLNLRSGNILRPTSEIGIPGFQDTTDHEEPRIDADRVDDVEEGTQLST